jgi:CRP-like cAMP-binding protein/CheY-like chemotaxis protein
MMTETDDVFIEISGYEFFATFPIETLRQMASYFQTKSFEPGDTILESGSKNKVLYFLRSGLIEVLLDDELISTLNNKGEIFGEMSVFANQPVSAQIRAATQVECFTLEAEVLDSLNVAGNNYEFLSILYRIHSNILMKRLKITNDKARKFEIANRKLLEAQDKLKALNETIEDVGRKKVVELMQSIRFVFERIGNLKKDHLKPLLDNLISIKSDNLLLDNTIYALQDAIKNVDPLLSALESESAIRSKSVLLIEPDKKQQSIAKMALGGTGVNLSIAWDSNSSREFLKKEKFDLVICDLSLADDLKDVFTQLPIGDVVLQGSGVILQYLEKVKSNEFLMSFLTRDPEDRLFTIKNTVTTANKLLSKDLFGIEKYLAWGADIRELTLNSSEKRREINDTVKEHFKSLGVRSSLLDRLDISFEEMLMNAVYDAPTNKAGKPLYNHLPRTEKITLSDEHTAKIRYGCDGLYAAVSVADPFGALSKKVLIDYVESCYHGRAGSMNAEKGGAGRGLHMLIESSDLTIFNVKKNVKTEVIVLFNLEAAAQKREIKPTFHFFFT